MADNRIVTFYPPPGGRFDLIAGLRTWFSHAGRIQYPIVGILKPFDANNPVEPIAVRDEEFGPNDLDAVSRLIDQHDVGLILTAKWYTLSIQTWSYHHANPPIMFWSFDPFLWGRMGENGLAEADGTLLGFARSAGAAYVVSTLGLGYKVLSQRFVRDGSGYHFELSNIDPIRGHSVNWVDVCVELGGISPTGYDELRQIHKPSGYTRHYIVGALPHAYEIMRLLE